jgi:biopolymer transport protein ExbB/TolQ
MELITKILFWISNGLLVPVVIALLVFFLRALLMIGAFYSQHALRRRILRALQEPLSLLTPDNVHTLQIALRSMPETALTFYMGELFRLRQSEIHRERTLAQFDTLADKDLGKSRLLVRLGPVLGLMGTLIPMGPALVGLSTGDVASMAYNMQVAFATTVVGLVTGAIGYVTLQVKQRWYATDCNEMEFISRLLGENQRNPNSKITPEVLCTSQNASLTFCQNRDKTEIEYEKITAETP